MLAVATPAVGQSFGSQLRPDVREGERLWASAEVIATITNANYFLTTFERILKTSVFTMMSRANQMVC